jgi:hypothetical protein
MKPSRRRVTNEVKGPAIAARRPVLGRVALTLLVVLTGWMLVASPLLVRNVRRYSTPLYNTNTWLLFVDAFEPSVALSQRQSVAETARAYWESHTLVEMARRAISGLAWEAFILLRMLGPCPLEDSRALVGLVLLMLAVLQLVARPSGEGVVLACWTALFVPFFAWYVPIAAGERFLFPLLAPLLILAAEGLTRLLGMGTGRDPARHRRRLCWTAAVWCAACLLLSYTTHWPVDAG